MDKNYKAIQYKVAIHHEAIVDKSQLPTTEVAGLYKE